jgi:hypothetical protein
MNKKIIGKRKHYDKGKNHSNWKGGKKRFRCKKCNRILSNRYAILCQKCYSKTITGKNNPFYKHGLPHCIDCGKLLKDYSSKRCYKHAKIYQYKNNPKTKEHLFKKKTYYMRKKIQLTCLRKNINKGRNNPMFGKPSPHGKRIKYGHTKFRSTWEYKYAKYLRKNHIHWRYEFKTFDLGNYTYTPDFYLIDENRYIEIKGWWRDKAKYKFELFKQKYSNIKINIINNIDKYE